MYEDYVIVLVTIGAKPVFRRIKNPAALFDGGRLAAVPSVYRIEKLEE